MTAQLICVFVFAYAKSRFSHDAAIITPGNVLGSNLKFPVWSKNLFKACYSLWKHFICLYQSFDEPMAHNQNSALAHQNSEKRPSKQRKGYIARNL